MSLYLCGYDGGPHALQAVQLAERLAPATGARAIAMSIRSSGEGGRFKHEDASEVPGTSVPLRVVLADTPAEGLHEAAIRDNASLLVVGTPRDPDAARPDADSLVHSLLHGAPCGVLVVPPGAALDVRRVGVAYDARPESENALAAADILARGLGARLVVLSVLDQRATQASADLVATLQRALADRLPRTETPAGAGDAPDLRILSGDPAPELERAAREGVDLLVTGSRRFGPVRSVLLGSVSRFLADRAPCPVLVVPRNADRSIAAHRPESFAYPAMDEGLH